MQHTRLTALFILLPILSLGAFAYFSPGEMGSNALPQSSMDSLVAAATELEEVMRLQEEQAALTEQLQELLALNSTLAVQIEELNSSGSLNSSSLSERLRVLRAEVRQQLRAEQANDINEQEDEELPFELMSKTEIVNLILQFDSWDRRRLSEISNEFGPFLQALNTSPEREVEILQELVQFAQFRNDELNYYMRYGQDRETIAVNLGELQTTQYVLNNLSLALTPTELALLSTTHSSR